VGGCADNLQKSLVDAEVRLWGLAQPIVAMYREAHHEAQICNLFHLPFGFDYFEVTHTFS